MNKMKMHLNNKDCFVDSETKKRVAEMGGADPDSDQNFSTLSMLD